MTTALYKLIFNAVQHHACQTTVQDINRCKIIFCVWQRVISYFFLFSVQLFQALELSHQQGVPLLQANCYVNRTDPVKVKEKQILFLCVLRNNTMDYVRLFCIWKDWDNLLKLKHWLSSWTLTQICIEKYDFRGWRGNERLSWVCLLSFDMLVAWSGDRKVGRSGKECSKLFWPKGERQWPWAHGLLCHDLQ